jgi:hypothetical protein
MLSRRRNATERNVEESLNEATCCCGVNQVRRLEGTATTRKRMTTDHSSSNLGAARIYYRALVGPLRSAEEAKRLCSGLKAAGGDCIIQKN